MDDQAPEIETLTCEVTPQIDDLSSFTKNDDLPSFAKADDLPTFTKIELANLIKAGDARFTLQEMQGKKRTYWTDFQNILFNGVPIGFIRCKICLAVLTFKTVNGTTTIRYHSEACRTARSEGLDPSDRPRTKRKKAIQASINLGEEG